MLCGSIGRALLRTQLCGRLLFQHAIHVKRVPYLEEFLADIVYPGEVDVDDLLPLLGLHPQHEAISSDASIVHQYIASPPLFFDGLEHGLDLIGLGTISLQSYCLATECLDFGHNSVGIILLRSDATIRLVGFEQK